MKKILQGKKFFAVLAIVLILIATFFVIKNISADSNDPYSLYKEYIQLLQKKNEELEAKKSAVTVHNGVEYGNFQQQLDSNQATIDWLSKDIPVLDRPLPEVLAALAVTNIPATTVIPENGDPIEVKRPNGETIKVSPAVVNNQIQYNKTIGTILATKNYSRDYIGNDGVGGNLYIQTADGKSQAVLDPYFDMLNDREGTPESIKSVDDIIAYYKKQQEDFGKVNLDIKTRLMNPTDSTNLSSLVFLSNNNARNLDDIISRGRKWVVIREALKHPERNSLDSDALSQFLIADPTVSGKEQMLSENAGIYNYVPAQRFTKESLDLAAKEFNQDGLLSAPSNLLTYPVASRTQGEIVPTTAPALTTDQLAKVEKVKTDEPLIRAQAKVIADFQGDSFSLAIDHYQNGLSNLLGPVPGFEENYRSGSLLVRQSIAEAALKSLESSGKIDVAALPAADPMDVNAYRRATGRAIMSFGAEPTANADSSLRLQSYQSKLISDDCTTGIGQAVPLRPSLASASTMRKMMASTPVQQHLSYSSRSSLSINPSTARPEFTTQIIDPRGTVIGAVGFDPIAGRYNGQLSQTFGDKKVTLYSDARTGYVYAALANQTGPLLKSGKLELTNLTVSKSGDIGGQFSLANRVFRYNPNSKAFEIPIASIIGQAKATDLAGRGLLGQALGNLSIDTNGTVVGSLNLTGKDSTNNGALFFDSTGNIGATYTFNQKEIVGKATQLTAIASFGISKDGISGSVNVGKLAFDKNLFVSFDKGGLSGVSIPIGAVGLGVGKDGSISLSSVIPIGGLPIPVSLSQDSHGNFGLGVPFIGTLVTFGHESRDLTAPPLQFTKDAPAGKVQSSSAPTTTNTASATSNSSVQSSSTARMECIFFRHSYKKMFKTVRTWNTESASGKLCPLEISMEEQKIRSNMIFDKYRNILKRNPTQEEFVEWYFYAGGNIFGTLYSFNYSSDNTFRTMQTKAFLDATLKSASYAKTCGTRCNDPANAMAYNPFNEKEVAEYQSKLQKLPETQTTAPGTVSMQDFFDSINKAAANDPYFNNGNYTIPGLGTASEGSTSSSETGQVLQTTGSDDTDRTYTDPNETSSGALAEEEVNQEEELVNNNVKVFSSGFSVFTVDSVDQAISAQPFIDAGLGIFEFNTDGTAKWKSNLLKDDIKVLKSGVGYYIYNPDKDDKTVAIESAYSEQVKGLNKGWNLLSNALEEPASLSTMVYDVIKPDATCQTSDCYETKTVRQVIDEGRTKGKLMKVIAGEMDAAKAFESVDLTQNLDTVEIPAKSIFWIYLAK